MTGDALRNRSALSPHRTTQKKKSSKKEISESSEQCARLQTAREADKTHKLKFATPLPQPNAVVTSKLFTITPTRRKIPSCRNFMNNAG